MLEARPYGEPRRGVWGRGFKLLSGARIGGGGGNGFSLPAPGGEQIPNHPPKAPGAKPGRRPPVAHALPAQLWLLLKGKRKLKSHFGRW